MTTKVVVQSPGLLGLGNRDRITWSGVRVGLVMMLVAQVLLSVLGVAVGLDRTRAG